MNMKYDFEQTAAAASHPIVYVRPVAVADLPAEVQTEAQGLDTLYAVHNESGVRLALVKDRRMAFFLALQNDMAPVSVH